MRKILKAAGGTDEMFKTLQELRVSASAEDGKKHAKRQGEQLGCSRRSKNCGGCEKHAKRQGEQVGCSRRSKNLGYRRVRRMGKNIRSGKGNSWDVQGAPRT
jgi:hypothetical protein